MYYQVRVMVKMPKNPAPVGLGPLLVVMDVLIDALNDWGTAMEREAQLDRMLRTRATGFLVPYGCTHLIPLATFPREATLHAFIQVSD